MIYCLQPDSDISAYTYERTLMMEQRNEIVKEMRLKKNALNKLVSIQTEKSSGLCAELLLVMPNLVLSSMASYFLSM